MPRRKECEMNIIRNQWRELMEDTDFRGMSMEKQGEQLAVSGETVRRWMKEVDSEQWEAWLKKDNQFIAPKVLKVDDTLYRQALSGDVSAIKLWKESKQGWSPKQINENLNRNAELDDLSEEEMLERALDGVSVEAIARILTKKRAGPVEMGPEPRAANGESGS